MPNITTQDVMRLINKMRVNYGKKFADQWTGVDIAELAQEMLENYQGLTVEDFTRGMARMKREKWPPTVPEFRDWCEPKSEEWLDAHEAWAIAKSSIEMGTGRELTVVWTEQAAKAFEKCADLVATGDKYQMAEAKKIFTAVYERLVTEAKDLGVKPVYTTSLGVDKDQQIAAIQQAQLEGFLPAPEAAAQLEYKQSSSELNQDAQKFKTTAQEALARIQDLIKREPVNKMIEVLKDPQEVESMEFEHVDPFDNFEQYRASLSFENKKIPFALRFMEEDQRVGGGV
ncbi:hypothetical protein G0029_06500 [Acinetobacter sp. YH12138]|uniref:hypothetical protein n=1 Tax=Acinetobacter sp. YH12138 TaxID=2601122 RepID=UPI0015D28C4C|nr:hypothetical protein [Acinetobacter sp. YH12138]QOW49477.1 hypothetical protein G0029_06500 [Acinetobacter sp. YH12138]